MVKLTRERRQQALRPRLLFSVPSSLFRVPSRLFWLSWPPAEFRALHTLLHLLRIRFLSRLLCCFSGWVSLVPVLWLAARSKANGFRKTQQKGSGAGTYQSPFLRLDPTHLFLNGGCSVL